MGVYGYKPLFAPLMEEFNLYSKQGARAGIDISCWIYPLTSDETILVEAVEEGHYAALVSRLEARCKRMRNKKIHPVVVLDGGRLNRKQGTHDARMAQLQAAEEKYATWLQTAPKDKHGNTPVNADLLRKVFTRTPALGDALVTMLLKNDIEFLVAPYEADAQLSFLSREGLVDFVMTLDADLVTFGAPLVVFPLSRGLHDLEHGRCLALRASSFYNYKNVPATTTIAGSGAGDETEEVDPGRTHKMCAIARHLGVLGLQLISVFAGCDYLPGGNTGIATAVSTVHAWVQQRRKTVQDLQPALSPSSILCLPIPAVSMDAVHAIIEEIIPLFTPAPRYKAIQLQGESPPALTLATTGFLQQVVWNPRSSSRVLVFDLPASTGVGRTLESAGDVTLPDKQAEELASGALCPATLRARAATATDVDAVDFGVRVLRALTPADTLPVRLTEALVRGATLPPERTGARWTREAMERFLRTRAWARYGKGGAATYTYASVSTSTLHAACEVALRESGAAVFSPEGLSLRLFYEKAGLPFDQRGRKLGDVPKDLLASAQRILSEVEIRDKVPKGAWVSHKAAPTVLEGLLPTMEDKVVQEYMTWTGGGGQKRPNSLGLVKGYKMFKEKPSVLKEFQAYARPVDVQQDRVPELPLRAGETDPRTVLFCTTHVPPTMKAGHYVVHLELLQEPGANKRNVVVRVLRASCTCKAGFARKCPHVAAALYVTQEYRSRVRAPNDGLRSDAWWAPRNDDTISPLTPVSHVPFVKHDRKKDKREAATGKRRRSGPARAENDGRWRQAHWDQYVADSYPPFDSEEMKDALKVFWVLCRRSPDA
jgi:hypothetical protein